MTIFVSALSILLSIIGLFLSAWILLPAPTFFWLTFSVGTPELSPWIVVLNSVALILGYISRKLSPYPYLWITICTMALAFSIVPLIQIPGAIQKANVAMEQLVPSDVAANTTPRYAQLRSQPVALKDVFFGIPIPKVRHLTGLKFPSKDQRSLDLELYLPPAPGQYPGIISIYGGAWQRGGPRANAQFNQYLSAQGYAVWAISYRHAPAYKFPTQLEDVQSALDYIQTHATEYETQPDQLALIGRSAGAHLAMLAAYSTSNPAIRGVINFYGPVNLTEGYNNPPNPDPIQSRKVLETLFGGPPTQFPNAYRDASPITYVTQPQPPTLLIYAGRDNIVQFKYGQLLFDRLRATGTQAVLLHIPWADHAFDAVFNGVSSQFSIYYAERFLDWVFQASS